MFKLRKLGWMMSIVRCTSITPLIKSRIPLQLNWPFSWLAIPFYHLLWLATIVTISQAQLPKGSYRAPNYHSAYNGYQASGRLSPPLRGDLPKGSYRAPNYHSAYNGYQPSARLSSWNRALDYDGGFVGYQASYSSRLSPSAGWFELELVLATLQKRKKKEWNMFLFGCLKDDYGYPYFRPPFNMQKILK